MQSFWACPATSPSKTGMLLALAGFADEVTGTLARLFAYVGALALLAILGLYGLDQVPAIGVSEIAARSGSGWSEAGRSHPAFSVSSLDPLEKTEPYSILRHTRGGRKDILRWSRDDKPIAELQIYRPGGELKTSLSPAADLGARMGIEDRATLESAGLIDSKFGTVALLQPTARTGEALSCLGFFRRIDDRALEISGWSCQGETLPARRAAIACTLNRLSLLSAGNEPKLAELFAHAELRRRGCGPAPMADWVTGMENPRLRGIL
ncbi:MAG: hypothetical protein HY852_14660 [Bradyrhizobium sp.]|nr:hypothetical protein [Bradyrhizobium sp.]MBI5263049.1 hypothetical protein [Bradyrhizobium sp.]